MTISSASSACSSPKFAPATLPHLDHSVPNTSVPDDTSSIAGSESSKGYASCEELKSETTLNKGQLEAEKSDLINDFRDGIKLIFLEETQRSQNKDIESALYESANENATQAANLIVDFLYCENKPLPTYIFDYLPDYAIKGLCRKISTSTMNFSKENFRKNLKFYLEKWYELTVQKTNLSECIKSANSASLYEPDSLYEKRIVELYKFIHNYRDIESLSSKVEEETNKFKEVCDDFLNLHPLTIESESDSKKNKQADFLQSLNEYKSALTTLWGEGAEIYFDRPQNYASSVDKVRQEEKDFSKTTAWKKLRDSKIHNQLKNRPNTEKWPVSLCSQFVYSEIHGIIKGVEQKTLQAALPEEDQRIMTRLGLSVEPSLPDVTPSLTALQVIQQLFKTVYDCTLGAFFTYAGKVIAYVLHSSKKADQLSAEVDSSDLVLEDINPENDETVHNDYQIVKNKLPDQSIKELQDKLNEDNILHQIALNLNVPFIKSKLDIHQNIEVSRQFMKLDAKYHAVYFNESSRKKPSADNKINAASNHENYILSSKLVDFCSHYDDFWKNQAEILLISDLLTKSSFIDEFLINAGVFAPSASKATEGQKSYAYFLSREGDNIKLIISFETNEKLDSFIGWEVALKINTNDEINMNDDAVQYITISPEDFTYQVKSKKIAPKMDASSRVEQLEEENIRLKRALKELTMLPDQHASSSNDDDLQEQVISAPIHTEHRETLEREGGRKLGRSDLVLRSESAVSRSRDTSPSYEQFA